MRVRGRRRRADRGAAAVETALVLPILLLVVFAIIDFGRMLNLQLKVTEAAREGVRAVSLLDEDGDETANDIAITVLGTVPHNGSADSLTPGQWTWRITEDCDGGAGEVAKFRIDYSFEFATPLGVLIGLADSARIPLSAEAAMPCRA